MAQTKVVYYVGDENTPYLVKVRFFIITKKYYNVECSFSLMVM